MIPASPFKHDASCGKSEIDEVEVATDLRSFSRCLHTFASSLSRVHLHCIPSHKDAEKDHQYRHADEYDQQGDTMCSSGFGPSIVPAAVSKA